MTRYVLGIDGGGTKTLAVIVDETGTIISSGLGGPSTYDDVGIDGAQRNIGDAVTAARQQANIENHLFDSVFLGLGGVVSDHDREVIRQIANNLQLAPAEYTGIDHDCRIALAGGLAGRPGIVQIAGTGTSTFGINAEGVNWRAGGWGQLIADEGSGYWLGIEAMKAAVMAYDGRGQATPLLGHVMQALNIKDINDIMHRIYVPPMPRNEIAELAPLVINAAKEGDWVSQAIIRRGMEQIAECITAVAEKLDMMQGRVELALTGGLFQAGDVVVQPLREAVLQQLPDCEIMYGELPPVLGACLLALEQRGIPVEATVIQNLHHSAAQLKQRMM